MEHLRVHPADCHVLFYSNNKSHADGNHPLAKDKVSICQIITKHVFKHDPEYANYYPDDPERFHDSMNSHISNLRKKYHDFHKQLHLTGAGVMPLDEATATNLHVQILEEFPWYNNLAGILGGNPAVSLKTISSVPGADHAVKYFSLMQGSTADNVQSSSSAQSEGWAPSAQPSPPNAQYEGYIPGAQPHPPSAQPTPPAAAYSGHYNSRLPSSTNYGGYVHSHADPSAPYHHAPHAQPLAPTPCQTYVPLPYSHPGQEQLHLPLNHEDRGMDYDNGGDDNDIYITGPHLTANYGGNITDLNSPPEHSSRHKHPRPPSSPSPPLTPPPRTKFKLPEKLQMTLHNSRAAFGMPDPMRRTSGVVMSMSPTSQPAGSNNAKGRPSKKACSDILSQVDAITDEIGSIRSERLDKVSRKELKNDCYMVKLNLTQQENEHWFLQAERQDECMDAATVHQCSQEAKDAEIRLHEAEARAHAEEAALLRLKIEYRQLTGGP
ncbi:hypothetical protein EDB19DRAFT_1918180 [Suillus lakei]|nr:hypothetical protein EDB19DRAFT_1918180 [Suillus lakei]